jgi:hypothetical protein
MKTAKLTVWSIAATAVLFLSSGAGAATVAVTYDVSDKALKEAVSGTMLTFELHSDPECTSLELSQLIAIDDVKVSKLKLFSPAGGIKAPKTDTLHAVMTGNDIAAGAFVKVTGTGITPVGGACQAQAGGSSGKIVRATPFGGGFFDSVIVGGPDFQFVGSYTTVFTTESQTMVATVQVPMRSGSQVTVTYDLCYQPAFSAGAPVSFAGSQASTESLDSSLNVRSYTVSGAVTPGAGAWDVGFCVKSSSAGAVDAGIANGVVMVMQN